MVYDLETLRRAWNAGEKFRFLLFWGHTPSADGRIIETCLSQWWPCRFVVDGVEYSCAEQFMMAEKARMFGDQEMLQKILEAAHPKQMKAYGRAVKGFDANQWESRRFEIVCRGSYEKFRQNPALNEYLTGTGRRVLVEASPLDRIWGIGMGKQNPDAQNPLLWKGKNLLGFALSKARDQLITEGGQPD